MMTWIALGLAFASIMCLTWSALPNLSARTVRQRLFAEEHAQVGSSLLNQLTDVMDPINRLLPTSWYSVFTWRRLEAAGLRLAPMHFFVLQEMGALTGVLIYMATMGLEHFNVGWLTIFVSMGFFVPYLWLTGRIQHRRESISRDLPEVVDLLSLCVDAGIDFMNALGRVVKEFRFCPTTEELGLVIQEVRVGKRRRDALRAFSTRVQTPEASSFSRTLVQADRMGTGIAEALRILSEDMRIQRYHWAERFAQRAPLKMLIPLLLSLAAALIIVAGPILIQFLQGGFGLPGITHGRL